jgi:carbonic anhydrase
MAGSPRVAAVLPLLAVLAACSTTPPPSGSGSCAWSYSGATGPAHWARICPQFAACGSGSRQTPIDIAAALARPLPPLTFQYGSRHAEVVDQGHTVDVEIAPGESTALEVGGRTYQLVQIHFHLPSEHKIDGRPAPMEMHMVHADEGGELAVVGVMMQEGPSNPVIAKIWKALDDGTHEIELDPADLLPGDRNYFGFAGSLTTPPCTEGVRWHVLRGSIALSKEQIQEFQRRYKMNARPLQNRNGRVIVTVVP